MPLVLDPEAVPEAVLRELHRSLSDDLAETLELVRNPRGTVRDPASLATAERLDRGRPRPPRPARTAEPDGTRRRGESRLRHDARGDRPREVAHGRTVGPEGSTEDPLAAVGPRHGPPQPVPAYPTAPVISSWMRRFSSSA